MKNLLINRFAIVVLALLGGCNHIHSREAADVQNPFKVTYREVNRKLRVFIINTSEDDVFIEIPNMGFSYSITYVQSNGTSRGDSNGMPVHIDDGSFKLLPHIPRGQLAGTLISNQEIQFEIQLDGAGELVKDLQLSIRYIRVNQFRDVVDLAKLSSILAENFTICNAHVLK